MAFKFWGRWKNRLTLARVTFILNFRSRLNRLRSLLHRNSTIGTKTYDGQPILLIALFEKGRLRPDIENLIRASKQLGLYVLGVNTLKLSPEYSNQQLIDCYIERWNFGRDFGSYKIGFQHIYQQDWDKQCPRLIMLNDSIFYSRANLTAFLSDLLNSKTEVLGATENHEIKPHLGSFCISMAGSIVRNEKLRKYWQGYSNSDVRPVVIKSGEMKLSTTLRRCTSSQDQMKALFDATRFSEALDSDQASIDEALSLRRTSDLVGWPRVSPSKIVEDLTIQYLVTTEPDSGDKPTTILRQQAGANHHFANSTRQITEAVQRVCGANREQGINEPNNEIAKLAEQQIKAELLKCFNAGSQIHQNAAILCYLGLPIIKLDGLYRGMFSIKDVEKIASKLDPSESTDFKALMYANPFGGDVLRGWKNLAFYRGLI